MSEDQQALSSKSTPKDKALEIRIWNAINAYAKSAGAENPVRDASTASMSEIEQVLADYRDAIEYRDRKIDRLQHELEEKTERLQDLYRACAVLKQNGKTIAVMLPGDLEMRIHGILKGS